MCQIVDVALVSFIYFFSLGDWNRSYLRTHFILNDCIKSMFNEVFWGSLMSGDCFRVFLSSALYATESIFDSRFATRILFPILITQSIIFCTRQPHNLHSTLWVSFDGTNKLLFSIIFLAHGASVFVFEKYFPFAPIFSCRRKSVNRTEEENIKNMQEIFVNFSPHLTYSRSIVRL